MTNMFKDCNYAHNLNTQNFDISNVEDMSYMFSNCLELSYCGT